MTSPSKFACTLYHGTSSWLGVGSVCGCGGGGGGAQVSAGCSPLVVGLADGKLGPAGLVGVDDVLCMRKVASRACCSGGVECSPACLAPPSGAICCSRAPASSSGCDGSSLGQLVSESEPGVVGGCGGLALLVGVEVAGPAGIRCACCCAASPDVAAAGCCSRTCCCWRGAAPRDGVVDGVVGAVWFSVLTSRRRRGRSLVHKILRVERPRLGGACCCRCRIVTLRWRRWARGLLFWDHRKASHLLNVVGEAWSATPHAFFPSPFQPEAVSRLEW